VQARKLNVRCATEIPSCGKERNDKGLIKLLSNDDLSFGALNGPFGVLMDVWVRQRFGITGLWCCGGAENANLNYGCRELRLQ
jgi:hypothetical protein